MDLANDKPLSRRRQRGTLAIVCLATMILCLDMAVANSALRRSRVTCTRDLAACSGSWTRTR